MQLTALRQLTQLTLGRNYHNDCRLQLFKLDIETGAVRSNYTFELSYGPHILKSKAPSGAPSDVWFQLLVRCLSLEQCMQAFVQNRQQNIPAVAAELHQQLQRLETEALQGTRHDGGLQELSEVKQNTVWLVQHVRKLVQQLRELSLPQRQESLPDEATR